MDASVRVSTAKKLKLNILKKWLNCEAHQSAYKKRRKRARRIQWFDFAHHPERSRGTKQMNHDFNLKGHIRGVSKQPLRRAR